MSKLGAHKEGLVRVSIEPLTVDGQSMDRIQADIDDNFFVRVHKVFTHPDVKGSLPIDGYIFKDRVEMRPRSEKVESGQVGNFSIDVSKNKVSIWFTLVLIHAGTHEAFGLMIHIVAGNQGAEPIDSSIHHTHRRTQSEETRESLSLIKKPEDNVWSEGVSVFADPNLANAAEVEKVVSQTLLFLSKLLQFAEHTAQMNQDPMFTAKVLIDLTEQWSDGLRLRLS